MANIARLKIFVIVTLSCEVWCQMQAWQWNWQGFSAFFTVFLFLNILWRQKLHSLNIITRKPDDMFNKKLLIGEKEWKSHFVSISAKQIYFPEFCRFLILNLPFLLNFSKELKGSPRSGSHRGRVKRKINWNSRSD